MHPRLQRSLFLLAFLLLQLSRSSGQGYSPAEAPKHMTLAAGLDVSLVASEPMLTQPVAIEFDDRGRLWVVQYIQYPNPAGLKRAAVDRWSRTTYDRVPEPPPRGPKGADRITILEDTNHDSHADVTHDFVNGLNLATGIAFGHGGVFVLNVPYLLFYPDTNRDDVPDGPPEVCLSGFGMEDAHSVANSLTWGPDGWLYGCQGSTVTAHIRGTEFQQGVWRYHPVTHEFELFCEGGGNAWGLDFDDEGELIYSTNLGPYRNVHGVQGGYYWKSFGKHGALHNPYAFGYYEHIPHTNFTGGHVTDGGIIYQGTNLPARFQGRYLCGDLLGHGVQWHEMYPWGTTFTSSHGGYLLAANDKWFASTDVTMGPDGSIYVADWCDKRTAHPDPDADWDRSNGRVYRIAAKATVPFEVADLNRLSTPQLIEELKDPNDWFVRKARRILADRRDPQSHAPLRELVFTSKDEHLALEAFWALYVSGGFDESTAMRALYAAQPPIRKWAIRFLGDKKHVAPELAVELAKIAKADPDVRVRLQLASSAKRLPAEAALPIVEALCLRDGDSSDPYIPLMIWWAVERHSVSGLAQVREFFTSSAAWSRTIPRDTIIPRLMRRWIAEGSANTYDAAAALLAGAPNASQKQMLVAALVQGFSDRPSGPISFGTGGLFAHAEAAAKASSVRFQTAQVTTKLREQLDAMWQADTENAVLIRAMAHIGNEQGMERARVLVEDSNASTQLRTDCIRVLGELGAAGDTSLFLKLIDQGPDALKGAAFDAAISLDPAQTAKTVMPKYSSFPPPLRARIRESFLARKDTAQQLLAAVASGKVAANEFTTEELRVVALHEDDALNKLVQKHWGRITPGTAEEKLAEMRRFNNDLNAGPGDPIRGHELFKNTCAVCHTLFGEGKKVGPDLTHANRPDREFLLASIVDPSAAIRKEFAAYQFELTDGRQLSGVIIEQNAGMVVVGNSTEERVVIPQSNVASMRESTISLMPEGLLKPFKPQDVRDLFSYLQSDKPLAKK
jgi:putative membrane-bound dehydrogenase-like protein